MTTLALARRAAPTSEQHGQPSARSSARIFGGLTVVAIEQAVAMPFATRQLALADLGERVIKVERPGAGDFARDYDTTVCGSRVTSCGLIVARRVSRST